MAVTGWPLCRPVARLAHRHRVPAPLGLAHHHVGGIFVGFERLDRIGNKQQVHGEDRSKAAKSGEGDNSAGSLAVPVSPHQWRGPGGLRSGTASAAARHHAPEGRAHTATTTPLSVTRKVG